MFDSPISVEESNDFDISTPNIFSLAFVSSSAASNAEWACASSSFGSISR